MHHPLPSQFHPRPPPAPPYFTHSLFLSLISSLMIPHTFSPIHTLSLSPLPLYILSFLASSRTSWAAHGWRAANPSPVEPSPGEHPSTRPILSPHHRPLHSIMHEQPRAPLLPRPELSFSMASPSTAHLATPFSATTSPSLQHNSPRQQQLPWSTISVVPMITPLSTSARSAGVHHHLREIRRSSSESSGITRIPRREPHHRAPYPA